MSDRHAVIFADEIGLPEAEPLREDEFICQKCNLVAHKHRRRMVTVMTGFIRLEWCNDCASDKFGAMAEFMPRGNG